MTNRKNLHDYGLVLILLGVLNLFNFLSTIIASMVDGSITNAFADVESDIIVAVRVVLTIIGLLMSLLSFADAFVGIKALKVSAKPTAENGYIIAAKVFFVFSVLSVIAGIIVLTDGNGQIVDKIINLANAVLSVVIYVYFIKAAQAVRRDVLNGEVK